MVSEIFLFNPSNLGMKKDPLTHMFQVGGKHPPGSFVYVVSNQLDQLTVLDVSDPSSPTVVGAVNDA